MFPTTAWTMIREAGALDPEALDDFAARYRAPVLQFIARRGFASHEAEDLCQDVFLRVLRGGVLAKADPVLGRFRSLLLTVTTRVIQDRRRRRPEPPACVASLVAVTDAEFDRAWALHLVERALERLRESGSPYYDVLEGHLTGRRQDRQKLWIARRKLADLVRREVADTCTTAAEAAEELTHLAPFLQPARKPETDEA